MEQLDEKKRQGHAIQLLLRATRKGSLSSKLAAFGASARKQEKSEFTSCRPVHSSWLTITASADLCTG
eukprot:1149942-Pelagomonas_calceolata.AAC.4